MSEGDEIRTSELPDQGSIHPSVVGKILSSKEYDRVDWDDLVQLAAGKLAADAAKAGAMDQNACAC